MIMDWPVTSKPYAIAAEDGKVRSTLKSLFRNYLQCLCQVKPSSDPSTAIQKSIVDAMRVVRMISIKMLIHQSFFPGQKMFFHISMAFPETTYISFLIITAILRIQKKFYLREELIEDMKGKFLV